MFEVLKNFWGRGKIDMLNPGMMKNIAGINIAMSPKMAEAVQKWKEMYEDKSGLHLPAAIAFEMARMITIELQSKVTGSKRAEFLDKSYQDVIYNIRTPMEYGCAKGGMVMKPYVQNGEIKVDFIQGDNFFPTDFDESGNISGAVFVQTMAKNGDFYTRLEWHRSIDTGYEILNKVFKSKSSGSLGREISLGDVPEWKDMIERLVISNVKKPLFGYFRPAVANSIDPTSPVGVSVFANAVNLIEDANRQYERFLWEFESGERALVANSMAFKHDRDGRPKLPDRRLYRTLDVEDIDFFREWSPELRGTELADGLDKIFRQIEFNCGLAYGTLSNMENYDRTAEEIRNSRQRSYSTISDNQKALKKALIDMVYAMDVWCTLCNLAPMGEYSISFEFDDSIAADRKTEFEEKRLLVEAGIMMPWEFRMWYFGEDEEAARSHIGAADKG
ncbi:MAG: phage portal protein [Clostridia bacterium]|nr:phage portal protein [Clostridia bacterium]